MAQLTGARSGTPAVLFGFDGQYTDVTTGFVNLRARLYGVATGSFTARDPAFATTDTAYTCAGGDPVNEADPSGLCDIFGNCWSEAWNTTGGKVVNFVQKHKRVIEVGVGIGLGVPAAGTGVGAVVEGATILGVGLSATAVAVGAGAELLDLGPCQNGDTAACIGAGLGLAGAAAGLAPLAGSVGVLDGGEAFAGTWAGALLNGLGAWCSFNLGAAGLTLDVVDALDGASPRGAKGLCH